MRWEGREESTNIEDRRGMPLQAGGLAVGGGIGTLLLFVIATLLGANPSQLLEQVGEQQEESSVQQAPVSPKDDPQAAVKKFVSVVMKDTEDVWGKIFKEQLGTRYQEPTLVLFNDVVRSACGQATAQVGPFYCPGDNNVYLDFAFFREMKKKYNAPGDFVIAYIIAHEVGHHVQNQLGISGKVQQLQNRANRDEANRLSVRVELQADYLAGVWAHHVQKYKQILEKGDIEEALTAASRIGDDALQKQAGQAVRPDMFTHGKSEQRIKWFKAGYETGDVQGMMKLFELDYNQL